MAYFSKLLKSVITGLSYADFFYSSIFWVIWLKGFETVYGSYMSDIRKKLYSIINIAVQKASWVCEPVKLML